MGHACALQGEEVFQRSTELTDPAVANVDHVLLLFGLTQPPVSETECVRHAEYAEHITLHVCVQLGEQLSYAQMLHLRIIVVLRGLSFHVHDQAGHLDLMARTCHMHTHSLRSSK